MAARTAPGRRPMLTRSHAASVLAAGVLMGLAQCANQPAGPPNARERAYRENNVGVARLEQYDYREAAASFRRALEADPRLAAARINLAIALLYDSQLDEADREARAAADQMPSAPQPPYVRGLIARLAGAGRGSGGVVPASAGDRPRRCRRQDSARSDPDRRAAERRGHPASGGGRQG